MSEPFPVVNSPDLSSAFVLTPIAAPVIVPPPRKVARPKLISVLQIINGEHFSGAERVQQLLGKQLGNFGFDAHFACVKDGKFAEFAGLPNDRISHVPMSARFDFSVVRKLERTVRERNIELLHAHTPRTALIASFLSMRTKTPWVYHVHSPAARDSTRGFVNRINKTIERYSIRSCNLLITVSRSLRREMLALGVPRSKLIVVANGVPAIEPIQAVERLTSKKWRIGLIALMRPRKGVEVALDAMRQLQEKDIPVELELIGSFESEAYQRQTLQHIEKLQLQNCVRLTGFTNDVPTAIRGLDALLLPSLFGEGMPMVVLEALAAAVPVIATRVEGTPEVVRDGIEGWLASPGDAKCLAAKIELVTSDRSEWLAMSHRALARHRISFSDASMAKRVAHAYNRVLQNCQVSKAGN